MMLFIALALSFLGLVIPLAVFYYLTKRSEKKEKGFQAITAMTENSKTAAVLRWAPPIFNALFKVALLAVLIWIGLGLQDVASAIYGSSEACVSEPDARNGSEEGDQPGVIKPLLRGST